MDSMQQQETKEVDTGVQLPKDFVSEQRQMIEARTKYRNALTYAFQTRRSGKPTEIERNGYVPLLTIEAPSGAFLSIPEDLELNLREAIPGRVRKAAFGYRYIVVEVEKQDPRPHLVSVLFDIGLSKGYKKMEPSYETVVNGEPIAVSAWGDSFDLKPPLIGKIASLLEYTNSQENARLQVPKAQRTIISS